MDCATDSDPEPEGYDEMRYTQLSEVRSLSLSQSVHSAHCLEAPFINVLMSALDERFHSSSIYSRRLILYLN